MEYLVSAEDINYHWWQIELLIQSFKLHGLEDKLVIAVAQNDSPKFKDFTRNLRNHKRVFYHENYGRQRNYLPLNKSYAAYIAHQQKLVEQPFTIIEPDMVLVRQVAEPHEHVGFQLKWLFTDDFVEDNGVLVKDHINKLLKDRNFPNQHLWFPIGSVYSFNEVPEDFFMRVITWTEKLEYERVRRLKKAKTPVTPWWDTGKVGWVLAMLDYYGMLNFQGHNDYEMTLIDNAMNNAFIHYTNGLPPVWSKYMYKYEPPDVLCMGGESPFEVLLEHNPTTSTNYLQQVIGHYIAEAKSDLQPSLAG